MGFLTTQPWDAGPGLPASRVVVIIVGDKADHGAQEDEADQQGFFVVETVKPVPFWFAVETVKPVPFWFAVETVKPVSFWFVKILTARQTARC